VIAVHEEPSVSDLSLLAGRRVLLVIAGGIAAYKCLDLIRRGRERGLSFEVILTEGGAQFVTPLSVSALTERPAHTGLWSLSDEAEMRHIRLSREADAIVVAPATADLLGKMANGLADDLASTALLAGDKPVLIAPAMNHRMWHHPATQRNLGFLEGMGVRRVGPGDGAMACGEFGPGRMAEPMEILEALAAMLGEATGPKPLAGLRALVTAGPTHEAIDPVRFIANRSSGKQGHAIAAALARLGAATTLVTGPVRLPDPAGVRTVRVETAAEMLEACLSALPVAVAVMTAAVADWRVDTVGAKKLKKDGGKPPVLRLVENPDILATIASTGPDRPRLVVGFAAETGDVVALARAKIARKGCDWIVANDVSPGTGTFGGDDNEVHLLRADGTVEDWPRASKAAVADRLATAIARHLAPSGDGT
jgi:phosphopantothenoylcysteine decarboxylase / phosphopantothenate---cysteine ligase